MYFETQSRLFADWIKTLKGRKVAVLSHARPDGDSIGSIVALVRILASQGVDVQGVSPDPTPRLLKFLLKGTHVRENGEMDEDRECAVLVDCADSQRIGDSLSKRTPEIIANIDHHISNEGYALRDFIIPEAAATCEILTAFALDLDLEIDPITAQALYAGILTDTGQFAYSNTTPRTFQLANKLCQKGADSAKIAQQIYEKNTLSRLHLLSRFLGRLQRYEGERICVGYLLEKDYLETGTKSEDADGFSSYTRAIEGVELGVFLEEKKEGIKGSFRTNNPEIRADVLAAIYGGGGHAAASGFFVKDRTLEELIKDILEAAKHMLE